MNLKTKKTFYLLTAIIIYLTAANSFFADDTEYISNKTVEIFCNDNSFIQPYDIDVASGTVTNQTEFNQCYNLDEDNGKYINFYIENTGNVAITITINGKKPHTLNPKNSGYIYLDVENDILDTSKSYTFKAVPSKNGGKISMNWIITQSDDRYIFYNSSNGKRNK